MFHHVKDLQFNARVYRPDLRFAKLMLKQIGGINGELKNAAEKSEITIMFDGTVSVKESLRYLITREVAHFQMFQSALDNIQVNFPPGILQSDPKFSNKYFNMSKGDDFKGAWTEVKSPLLGEE